MRIHINEISYLARQIIAQITILNHLPEDSKIATDIMPKLISCLNLKQTIKNAHADIKELKEFVDSPRCLQFEKKFILNQIAFREKETKLLEYSFIGLKSEAYKKLQAYYTEDLKAIFELDYLKIKDFSKRADFKSLMQTAENTLCLQTSLDKDVKTIASLQEDLKTLKNNQDEKTSSDFSFKTNSSIDFLQLKVDICQDVKESLDENINRFHQTVFEFEKTLNTDTGRA